MWPAGHWSIRPVVGVQQRSRRRLVGGRVNDEIDACLTWSSPRKFEVVRVIVCDDDGRIWEFGRITYLDLLSLYGRGKKGMMQVSFLGPGKTTGKPKLYDDR
jgi:hypothetical protein